MSIAKEDIEATLYTWVNSQVASLGVATIFANQNAPRPSGPYVTIHVMTAVEAGQPEHQYTDTGGGLLSVVVENLNEVLVSVNVYRGLAFTLAAKVRSSLKYTPVLEALFAGGLGFAKATTVRDMHEEIDKQWEDRAQFDCIFYALDEGVFGLEAIEKVEVTNNINGDGDTVVIEKP